MVEEPRDVIWVRGFVVITLVTCETGTRKARKLATGMTINALHGTVRSRQRKSSVVMREGRRLPGKCCMAGLTYRREFRKCVVRAGRCLIVGLMARIAILSRVLENLVLVTGNARNRLVCAAQWESGETVVKPPAPQRSIHLVAPTAIC